MISTIFGDWHRLTYHIQKTLLRVSNNIFVNEESSIKFFMALSTLGDESSNSRYNV